MDRKKGRVEWESGGQAGMALTGKYVMHSVLRYQACDNAQWFLPKTLPVRFDVKVVKEKTTGGRNPAQSPHVHN
jgi:hypothetical protein